MKGNKKIKSTALLMVIMCIHNVMLKHVYPMMFRSAYDEPQRVQLILSSTTSSSDFCWCCFSSSEFLQADSFHFPTVQIRTLIIQLSRLHNSPID